MPEDLFIPRVRPKRRPDPDPRPITLNKTQVAKALGISRRQVDRLRAAGQFPLPDQRAGCRPLWLVATIRRWAAGDGGDQ